MATQSAAEVWLDKLVRAALYYSPLRSFALHKYRYAFTPSQLATLITLLDEGLQTTGDLLEIGCYRGYTTVLLNKHLDEVSPARGYVVMDTFGGFTSSSVAHEVAARGKSAGDRALAKFTVNSEKLFRANLRENGIHRVTVLRGDVCAQSLPEKFQACFSLVDVDLYLPTLAGLRLAWKHTALGGVIVVDDCQPAHIYDGSRQALDEFSKEVGAPFEVRAFKLGVIRKPRV